MTSCLVVGVALYGAGVAADALIAKGTVSSAVSLASIQRANNVLGTTLSSFPSSVAACNQQLTCVTRLDGSAGQALEVFASSVRATGVPGSAATDANTLANDSDIAGRDLVQLGSATSVAQYQSIVAGSNLQQDLDQVTVAYVKLTQDLGAR